MRFCPLYLRLYKNTHFQCRPFWIANCCPHGKNHRWVQIDLKLAYQNYPIKPMSCFYHSFEQSYNLCAMTNLFSYKITANHGFGGHLGFENVH